MRRDKAIKFMKLARYMAELFSKDPSRKVATILVKPETLQLLSVGYNGMARNVDELPPERWMRPAKYAWVSHSELNAICNAASNGTNINNAIAIVTLFPCCCCARSLIQSGIKYVVTFEPDFGDPIWGEEFRISQTMMSESGVEIMLITEKDLA